MEASSKWSLLRFKSLFAKLLILATILVLPSCAKNKPMITPKKDLNNLTTVANEFSIRKKNVNDGGGVSEIGRAKKASYTTAYNASVLMARKGVADIYEIKLENLTKQFEEELGDGYDVEINETFSSATKSLTAKVLNFTTVIGPEICPTEIINNRTWYTCFTLAGIEPTTLQQSLLDELKNKNKKTYERFRASEAFKELDEAVKEYEAKYDE